MNSPRISWEIREEFEKDEFEYTQYKSYTEEGSFIPGDYIEKELRVWNNHSGSEDVQDALDCSLIIAFKNFEDSFLLNMITVYVDSVEKPVEIDIDKGVVSIGSLSGVANAGIKDNSSNFKNLKIIIGPIPSNIKSELKSMYFYLEYMTE